jgi:tetratricopeptide (TPR) repeat protein
MKNKLIVILAIFKLLLLYSCASNQVTQPQIPQQQATRVLVPPPAPVYWTGDGGRGITLAVLEPVGRGLSETEQWMLSMIQSSITGDFQRFSAMTIVDRQNLERILYVQRQSLSGNFSDDDFISIGKLTNAHYILTGSITRTATAYMLELGLTNVETGERRASYTPQAVSPFALENLSAIREATTDLLRQLGVNLTEQGRQELSRVANTGRVQAETALARGISAERQGTIVEALSYFIQASSYDSGLAEAISRMNILAANISSGNIGEDTRNEIAWRRQWIARLQETETFFANTMRDPQPFYIVYSTDIQRGTINWQNETIDLSVWMGFYPDFAWSNQINGVINAVRDALQATGRAQFWELDWPSKTISTPSPFNNRINNSTSTVVVEIINEQGRSIGRQTVRAPYGFEVRDTIVTPLWQWEGNVLFTAVDANFITDMLSIRITSIDGIAAENAVRQKRISVLPQAEWQEVLRINPTAKQNIEVAQIRHRADEFRRQADEHLRNGNVARAIADYSEAIRLNANDVLALNGRGNAYLRNGEHNRAIADWNSLLRINPNFTEARQSIERAQQLQQQEQERQQMEQHQRAEALVDQGRRNFDIRDYNRALADFTEAIRLNPNLSTAYFQRARTYRELRQHDRAISDYTQVIRLNPNDWAAYHNRGREFTAKGDYDNAIADFTEAIRINSNHAPSYIDRGFAYIRKRNWNMAIADNTEAIRLNPNSALAHNNRGSAHESAGNLRQAFADYETAVRLDPNNALFNDNLLRLRRIRRAQVW